ncbi:MAG TPA: bifunctional UDP-N-acetylglucosamine diphosphorylase/glucosamine-1-phosphate N-acetyltransferase GlmU [Candidatus Xenobia bacterium]|jgi:bifunctional UDP-N-acetylglucosamine pyrophosphorylase/glucosamine-1-phosphate N-acetyltransferase
MNAPLMVVVMAAGKGTRMKSALPKVLHPVCGEPMLGHVLHLAEALQRQSCYVIVGHGADEVQRFVGTRGVCVVQEPQNGTGHAVQQVLPYLQGFDGDVVILSADVPLVTREVTEALLVERRKNTGPLTMLTARVLQSPSLGRVLVDQNGHVTRIVEARECTPEQRQVDEVNAGVYCASAAFLREYLPRIGMANVQNEIYLTDLVVLATRDGRAVSRVLWEDPAVTLGINTRVELAAVDAIMRRRLLEALMLAGVTIIDPAATYVDAGVSVGQDSVLLPGTMLHGKTRIGKNVQVGPQTRIIDSEVGDGAAIQNSVVLEARIGPLCTVGPFAYLRPGTVLAEGVKVGDFVEIKNATIAEGSKVPHLSYVGDATIGRHVNIGAGTITCNYDGKHKHRTTLGDNVFIGSNTNLVAPVTLGNGASTGAGAVVTKDVPDNTVVVGVPARVLKSRVQA